MKCFDNYLLRSSLDIGGLICGDTLKYGLRDVYMVSFFCQRDLSIIAYLLRSIAISLNASDGP